MSSTPNPPPVPDPLWQLEPIPPLAPEPPRSDENPSWTGWDVLQIALLTLVSIIVMVLGTTYAAQRLLYRKLAVIDVAKFPLVSVVGQLLAYALVFAFMVAVVKRINNQDFWPAIRWNWPSGIFLYVVIGVALSIGLQAVANLLPMPKELPIDRFFQTAREAWVVSIFGVTVAPLMEELFFRGFLYPVLARQWGMTAAILVTALGFGLIHAPQLAQAWGPVLVIFLVGIALTAIRARTKSVAASLIVHIAYNGTISVILFFATSGFRHLEKLNQ